MLKQSRDFSLPPFTTGCLCVFTSPPQYQNGVLKSTIYYGVGLTYRQNTNRGRGDSAARALAAKAVLYQMGQIPRPENVRPEERGDIDSLMAVLEANSNI